MGPFCWCFPRGKYPPRLGHATYATSQQKLDGMGRREEQRAPALLRAWVDMKSRKIANQEHAGTPRLSRGGVIEALATLKAKATTSRPSGKLKGASFTEATANNITGASQPPTSPKPKTEDSSELHGERLLVMAAKKTKKGKAKAQEREPASSGVTALESHSTLGLALQGKKRFPKPRSSSQIDELVWSKAMLDAHAQIQEYSISCSIDGYYSKMCQVGKRLVARSKLKNPSDIL